MNYILSKVSSGVGVTLAVAGVGTGIVTTSFAALYGLPVAIVGISAAAPVACVYDIFLGQGALTTRAMNQQLDKLKQDNDIRANQLQQADEQIKLTDEQIKQLQEDAKTREHQLQQANEQIKSTDWQIEQLKEDAKTRQKQLEESQFLSEKLEAQLSILTEELHDMSKLSNERQNQLKEQDEQIKKLFEIHTNLRLALQGLAIAGDTFNSFGSILSEHTATLSEKIEQISITSANLDQTAQVLSALTNSLETHIQSDKSLVLSRDILFNNKLL